jgi:predicted nucleic acid-binding protein
VTAAIRCYLARPSALTKRGSLRDLTNNRRDVHHGAAVVIMQRLVAGEWGPTLLPEYVFLEVVTVLLARRGLHVAVEVATTLLHAKGGRVRALL